MCLLAWFRALGHKQAPASRKKKKQQQHHQTNKSKSEPVVVYAISEGVTKMGVSSTECAIRGSSAGAGVLGPAPGSAKLQHHPCGHCCAAANMLVQNAPQQQQQQNQNHQSHHGHQHQHQHQHHHHHHGHHQQQQAQHHSHHQQPQPQQQMGKHHHHHHHHHHVQEVLVTPHHNNNNNNGTSSETHIFAPLKSKMKVLKKIKKKMGLAPRSSNAGTNNLPPLTFHQVHGDNIRLCNGNTIAKRQESFCKGVTFSARPVRVGEKVCVKFLEISDNWSGVIRFGFTSNDPSNLRSGLPRYACPDLTNKPGYWAKALAERFAEPDTVLFYYVTSAGDVHFGVNGEEKGVFFSGVETRSPLWAIIDVYGNSTAIEFVDPNRQHFNNNNNNNNNSSNNNSGNNARRSAEHASNEDNAQHSRHSAMEDASNAGRDLERIIVPSLQSVSIHQEPDVELPGLRFQPQGMLFSPLPFHSTRGRNIRFSNQQCVASRSDTEFCHGYAFTNRPLLLGERIVVQILATEPMYVGALALGLTSCDPSRLGVEDLPDDSDLLLDRPEYWVVSKDVASSPQPGDEIAFTVSHFGEVQMSKNGGSPSVVMHVDQSLQLWAFVDVYGSTQRVRMLASRPPCSPPRQQRQLPAASPAPTPAPAPAPVLVPAPELSRISEMVQFKPALGGGTVLVVNLPPQAPYPAPPGQPTTTPSTQQQQAQPIYGQTAAHRPRQALAGSSPPNFTATMASTGSSTYVEPVSYQSQPATSQQQSAESSGSSSAAAAASHLQQWREGLQPPGPGQPSECSICYERNIDSVLYMCGHMCMCYTCAVQQWRGKGGGHCPLCRATIRDVIRIYRS